MSEKEKKAADKRKKGHTNPIKEAINKIPSKLEQGASNLKSNLKKALIDPVKKAGKAYAEGKIPLTIPNMQKHTKKRMAHRNIKKIVEDVAGKKYGGRAKPYGMKNGGQCKGMGKATRGGKFTVS